MRLFLTLFFAALLTSCTAEHKQADNTVKANDYEAFWLWAGVKPQEVLDDAKHIYILAGEVRAAEPDQIVYLRPAPNALGEKNVWLVLRVETIDGPPELFDELLSLSHRWERAGNKLAGIQIDFDAGTRGLDNYTTFLKELRSRMPEHQKLSITGLLDWSANGGPAELNHLAITVDEVVFQVYQGRKTIAGYKNWLRNLDKMPMPFRIGLVQGGEWDAPASLAQNPNFEGYVVFLLNPERQD